MIVNSGLLLLDSKTVSAPWTAPLRQLRQSDPNLQLQENPSPAATLYDNKRVLTRVKVCTTPLESTGFKFQEKKSQLLNKLFYFILFF